MTTAVICRIAGGVLVLLVGAALGAGGFQLLRSGPEPWPDIVADAPTVQRTAGGMMILALLLVIAGVAVMAHMPWGGMAAAASTLVVVVAAFWVNQLLFGGIRALHTGTNVVVAAIICALLWFGYASPSK